MSLNPSVTTLSGLAADQPTDPGFVGVFYFATDTGAVTCWDGTAWQTVSGAQANAVELEWLRLRVFRIARALTLFGIQIEDELFDAP